MDGNHFDRLARVLGTPGTRRHALAALLAGLVAGQHVLTTEAKGGKGKGKGKQRNGRTNRQQHGKDRHQDGQRIQAQAEPCFPGTRCTPKKGANLSRCDLGGSTAFTGLDCTGCNLSYANLHGVTATGANFTRANLSYSCLVDADLTGATIAGNTNISFATFCRTKMPNGNFNNGGCNSPTPCCPTCQEVGGTGCNLGGGCCGGGICQSNTCVCPSGQTSCSGTCRNLQNDANNCGSCGHACGQGQSCCSGVCKNLNTDASNCGACNHACAANEICDGGDCACAQGYYPCGSTGVCIPDNTCCNQPDNCGPHKVCSGPGGTCSCVSCGGDCTGVPENNPAIALAFVPATEPEFCIPVVQLTGFHGCTNYTAEYWVSNPTPGANPVRYEDAQLNTTDLAGSSQTQVSPFCSVDCALPGNRYLQIRIGTVMSSWAQIVCGAV